jgi:hypothetical protein
LGASRDARTSRVHHFNGASVQLIGQARCVQNEDVVS